MPAPGSALVALAVPPLALARPLGAVAGLLSLGGGYCYLLCFVVVLYTVRVAHTVHSTPGDRARAHEPTPHTAPLPPRIPAAAEALQVVRISTRMLPPVVRSTPSRTVEVKVRNGTVT